jgi:hypothetical protein
MFLIILGVATAFVFVIVKGLEWGFDKMDEANQGTKATAIEGQRKLPPAPRLQGAPDAGSTTKSDVPSMLPLEEMKVYRDQVEERTKSYGVDKKTGASYIPIERAKELVAEKGLPEMTSPSIAEEMKRAEAARKQMLNADASAGRTIKKQ